MKAISQISAFRLSLRPAEYSLLAASAGLLALIAVTNPIAALLPVSGTIAAVTMVWSIDRIQATFSGESQAGIAGSSASTTTDGANLPEGTSLDTSSSTSERKTVAPCKAD